MQGFKDVHQSLCKDEVRQCGSWLVSGYGREREPERGVMGAYNQVDGLKRGQSKTKNSEQKSKGNWKVHKVQEAETDTQGGQQPFYRWQIGLKQQEQQEKANW